MIKAKQYFINFSLKIEFEAKTGGWTGEDFSNHTVRSVGRIEM